MSVPYSLLLIACLLAATPLRAVYAQDSAGTPQPPALPEPQFTYFTNSQQPSTARIPFRSASWRVYVFNRAGDTLYRFEDHHYSYSQSTSFKFYPDSAVRQIRHSWNPGAGIQWGYETIELSPEGLEVNRRRYEHGKLLDPRTFTSPATRQAR